MATEGEMTPNRPYLIRALYQWIIDNDLTPYLLVDTDRDDVHVPMDYVQDNRIVLNIGPVAVQQLHIENELITFSARFGGKAMNLSFPPMSVPGIYARENGKGMLFPDEEEGPAPDDEPSPPQPSGGRPSLKVVK